MLCGVPWNKIKPFARQMRQESTPAEDALWQQLRRKSIGNYKFRRQHPIDRFIVDFLRSVPAVVLIPLALLRYGASLKMKLTIIVFACTWDMLVQALYAVRQVDPVALDALRAFNLSRYNAFKALHLPSALPFLTTGVRLAAIHALLLSIGVELVGGVPGLGQELFLAGQVVNGMPTMFAYVGVAGIAGMLLNEALAALDKKLLYGHPGYRS